MKLDELKSEAAKKLAVPEARTAVELLAKIAMEVAKDVIESFSPAFVRPLEDLGAEKLEDLAEEAIDAGLTKLAGGSSTVQQVPAAEAQALKAGAGTVQVLHVDAALV